MPLPEFTDAEVGAVASALRIDCDDERRVVLRHRTSVDIRACAGSGKTTLLVAKLALTLGHWTERFRGICIISHTNVAHEEIRRRFDAMPRLRALENYPHFLGTIQSFVNMTLGIPGAVELYKTRPTIIDDDAFARLACRAIGHPSFSGARAWLSYQHNGDGILTGLRLELQEDGTVGMGSSGGPLPAPTTATAKALLRLKRRLIGDGVFRYDDIDACAHWYAQKRPNVVAAVAHRFPVVFMDETQDTAHRQGQLLDHVFNGRSVVQRFGDDRQAIYRGTAEDDAGVAFPNVGYLSMTTSLRLSPSIAGLAENVCLGPVERLAGNPARLTHQHTVLLFAADRIDQVLPAFATLVSTQLGAGIPSSKVVAVGFRRSGDVALENIPGVITDYWRPGVGGRRPVSATFETLSEYVRAAQADLRTTGNTMHARARMLQAACRLLELQGVQDASRPYNVARMVQHLREVEHRHAPMLMRGLAKSMLAWRADDVLDIDAVTRTLREGLAPFNVGEVTPEAALFCEVPTSLEPTPQANENSSSDGVFRLQTAAGLVQVGFGTIHSVKGETLDAVLVLTTFFHAHDLKQLVDVGILRARRPTAAQSRQKRLQENVKRIYVAMTRPSRLLCLAMPMEHVSAEHRVDMERVGWMFQTV